jgi:ATP-dependent Clp protease protease subunit
MEFEAREFYELVENIVTKIQEEPSSFPALVDYKNATDRHIYLGDIVPGTGSDIDSRIRFWNQLDDEEGLSVEERKPIKIYIDSCGGSLVDTFTMIDSISMSRTPVYTICTGAAYSGGFFTFIAGHKRLAYPLSSFLYHEGATGTSADAGKFRNFAAFYEKQLKQLKDIVLKYTTITEEQYEKHIKDDWWFTAEEALEYGICDIVSEALI